MKLLFIILYILGSSLKSTAQPTPANFQEPIKKEILQFIYSIKIIEDTIAFKKKQSLEFCFFNDNITKEIKDLESKNFVTVKNRKIIINLIDKVSDKCDVYLVDEDSEDKIKDIKKEDTDYAIIGYDIPLKKGVDVFIYEKDRKIKYEISDRLEYGYIVRDFAQNIPLQKTSMYARHEKSR